VTGVSEKEANEIIVYLASKEIEAYKVEAETSAVGSTETSAPRYNILVEGDRGVEAMSLLNQVGLPRKMGTNLLELFAKSGLMSTDREETIRYQAGLAQQLQNTIRKIDGVIDADVQLSFPQTDPNAPPGTLQGKTTAAVYIKHQGILDDPNSHLEMKIKRLLAGSVSGLQIQDVAVISDRARLGDTLWAKNSTDMIGKEALQHTYVSIWGVVMTKASALRFRLIFFFFIVLVLLALGALGAAFYLFYPQMKQRWWTKTPEEIPPLPSRNEPEEL
jgi:type III secretion protein J